MPDFLSLFSPVATGVGVLGSLFGQTQQTNYPPELQFLLNELKKRSQVGLGNNVVQNLARQLSTRLSSEFSALSERSASELTRGGAGLGVQQAARSSLDTQRLSTLGTGTTQIGLANEQAKAEALTSLQNIMPALASFTTNTGGFFSDLLGSGISGFAELSQRKRNDKLINAILGK